MRKMKEALRLVHGLGLSQRQTAQAIRVPRTTAQEYLAQAAEAGVTWPLPADLDDAELERLLLDRTAKAGEPRPEPDWRAVSIESRRKGVTLQLRWQEYRSRQADGYSYSRFCEGPEAHPRQRPRWTATQGGATARWRPPREPARQRVLRRGRSRRMLIQPTLDKLSDMRLAGLRRALEEQLANPKYSELSFEDRIGLLCDQEWTRRQDSRLNRRPQHAQFRLRATLEAMDFAPGHGLQLVTGEFLLRRLNIIVSGPTDVGKTCGACAVGRSVCRAGFVVRYERLSGLPLGIQQAHGEASWAGLVRSLARMQLLVIDDRLRDPVTPGLARDLAEILDDRDQSASTLLATQAPVGGWHARLGDQDVAGGTLDQIIHKAYRIETRGGSQLKLRSPLPIQATAENHP